MGLKIIQTAYKAHTDNSNFFNLHVHEILYLKYFVRNILQTCAHINQSLSEYQYIAISPVSPVKAALNQIVISVERVLCGGLLRCAKYLIKKSLYLKRPCGESVCCWLWARAYSYGLSLLGLHDVRGLPCLVS